MSFLLCPHHFPFIVLVAVITILLLHQEGGSSAEVNPYEEIIFDEIVVPPEGDTWQEKTYGRPDLRPHSNTSYAQVLLFTGVLQPGAKIVIRNCFFLGLQVRLEATLHRGVTVEIEDNEFGAGVGVTPRHNKSRCPDDPYRNDDLVTIALRRNKAGLAKGMWMQLLSDTHARAFFRVDFPVICGLDGAAVDAVAVPFSGVSLEVTDNSAIADFAAGAEDEDFRRAWSGIAVFNKYSGGKRGTDGTAIDGVSIDSLLIARNTIKYVLPLTSAPPPRRKEPAQLRAISLGILIWWERDKLRNIVRGSLTPGTHRRLTIDNNVLEAAGEWVAAIDVANLGVHMSDYSQDLDLARSGYRTITLHITINNNHITTKSISSDAGENFITSIIFVHADLPSLLPPGTATAAFENSSNFLFPSVFVTVHRNFITVRTFLRSLQSPEPISGAPATGISAVKVELEQPHSHYSLRVADNTIVSRTFRRFRGISVSHYVREVNVVNNTLLSAPAVETGSEPSRAFVLLHLVEVSFLESVMRHLPAALRRISLFNATGNTLRVLEPRQRRTVTLLYWGYDTAVATVDVLIFSNNALLDRMDYFFPRKERKDSEKADSFASAFGVASCGPIGNISILNSRLLTSSPGEVKLVSFGNTGPAGSLTVQGCHLHAQLSERQRQDSAAQMKVLVVHVSSVFTGNVRINANSVTALYYGRVFLTFALRFAAGGLFVTDTTLRAIAASDVFVFSVGRTTPFSTENAGFFLPTVVVERLNADVTAGSFAAILNVHVNSKGARPPDIPADPFRAYTSFDAAAIGITNPLAMEAVKPALNAVELPIDLRFPISDLRAANSSLWRSWYHQDNFSAPIRLTQPIVDLPWWKMHEPLNHTAAKVQGWTFRDVTYRAVAGQIPCIFWMGSIILPAIKIVGRNTFDVRGWPKEQNPYFDTGGDLGLMLSIAGSLPGSSKKETQIPNATERWAVLTYVTFLPGAASDDGGSSSSSFSVFTLGDGTSGCSVFNGRKLTPKLVKNYLRAELTGPQSAVYGDGRMEHCDGDEMDARCVMERGCIATRSQPLTRSRSLTPSASASNETLTPPPTRTSTTTKTRLRIDYDGTSPASQRAESALSTLASVGSILAGDPSVALDAGVALGLISLIRRCHAYSRAEFLSGGGESERLRAEFAHEYLTRAVPWPESFFGICAGADDVCELRGAVAGSFLLLFLLLLGCSAAGLHAAKSHSRAQALEKWKRRMLRRQEQQQQQQRRRAETRRHGNFEQQQQQQPFLEIPETPPSSIYKNAGPLLFGDWLRFSRFPYFIGMVTALQLGTLSANATAIAFAPLSYFGAGDRFFFGGFAIVFCWLLPFVAFATILQLRGLSRQALGRQQRDFALRDDDEEEAQREKNCANLCAPPTNRDVLQLERLVIWSSQDYNNENGERSERRHSQTGVKARVLHLYRNNKIVNWLFVPRFVWSVGSSNNVALGPPGSLVRQFGSVLGKYHGVHSHALARHLAREERRQQQDQEPGEGEAESCLEKLSETAESLRCRLSPFFVFIMSSFVVAVGVISAITAMDPTSCVAGIATVFVLQFLFSIFVTVLRPFFLRSVCWVVVVANGVLSLGCLVAMAFLATGGVGSGYTDEHSFVRAESGIAVALGLIRFALALAYVKLALSGASKLPPLLGIFCYATEHEAERVLHVAERKRREELRRSAEQRADEAEEIEGLLQELSPQIHRSHVVGAIQRPQQQRTHSGGASGRGSRRHHSAAGGVAAAVASSGESPRPPRHGANHHHEQHSHRRNMESEQRHEPQRAINSPATTARGHALGTHTTEGEPAVELRVFSTPSLFDRFNNHRPVFASRRSSDLEERFLPPSTTAAAAGVHNGDADHQRRRHNSTSTSRNGVRRQQPANEQQQQQHRQQRRHRRQSNIHDEDI